MRKLLCLTSLFMLVSLVSWAQKTVSGRVTDDKGNPLPNVSVLVKGTSVGTVSKDDGTYSLTVPSNGRVLVFSFANMTTEEVSIGTLTEVNASMRPSENSLENVVVVGYGTQRR